MADHALRVLAAGFAPVKGIRHLSLPAVDLDHDGPVGDRRWCLVDTERRRVLRTVQHPSLVAVRAQQVGDALHLTLPDGATVGGRPEPTGERLIADYWGREVPLELTAGPHSELLSGYLGTPVRLAAAPPGGVVFGDPVTLVTTGSLRDLAERTGRPPLATEAARFRPSLVVESETAYAEDDWLGREVTVGNARLRIGAPIPRCAVVDLSPTSGVKDAPVLKTLAAHRPLNRAGEPCFGVFARVVTPGRVLAG